MFLFSSWNPSIIHISSVFKNKNISNILLICNWRNELLEIYVFLLRVISKEILQLSLDPDAVSENVDQVSHTNFPNPGRIWGWGGRCWFWKFNGRNNSPRALQQSTRSRRWFLSWFSINLENSRNSTDPLWSTSIYNNNLFSHWNLSSGWFQNKILTLASSFQISCSVGLCPMRDFTKLYNQSMIWHEELLSEILFLSIKIQ